MSTVPRLLRRVEGTPHGRVTRAKLVAAAALLLVTVVGSSRCQDNDLAAKIADLQKQLKDTKPATRMAAAEGLAALGPKARIASRDLCEAMLDTDKKVRVTAADALKAVNRELHPHVVPLCVVSDVYDNDDALRQIALLGEKGKPAVPVLVAYLDRAKGTPLFRDGPLVIDALAKIAPDDPKVTDQLAHWLLSNGNAKTRVAIAKALTTLKHGRRGATALARVLQASKVPEVRLACAEALGVLARNTPVVVEALTAAKTDDVERVREAARAALVKVLANPQENVKPARQPLDKETKDKIEALVKGLKDKQAATRVKAAEGLAELGEKASGATSELVAALFDAAQPVRVVALDALKKVNPTLHGPVAALIEPVTDQFFLRPEARSPFVAAVRKLSDLRADARPAVPVLLHYWNGIAGLGVVRIGTDAVNEPYIVAVIEALTRIAPDDPTVKQALAACVLRGTETPSRAAAVKALVAGKDAKVSVPVLAQVARADQDVAMRLLAVQSLGEIGADAKAAVPVIEAAKTDADGKVREAARKALEQIKK
jgi:HEAT repeat protein